jgi:hypothetical protein
MKKKLLQGELIFFGYEVDMWGKWGTLYTLQEDEITHGLERN